MRAMTVWHDYAMLVSFPSGLFCFAFQTSLIYQSALKKYTGVLMYLLLMYRKTGNVNK